LITLNYTDFSQIIIGVSMLCQCFADSHTFWKILFHTICDFVFRDILMGLMKRLVKHRSSNLKVLITSATLDGDKVSKFFRDCPVLNIPGKLYPVEVLYSKERPVSYLDAALKTALGMM
jgi:hypothetical protein